MLLNIGRFTVPETIRTLSQRQLKFPPDDRIETIEFGAKRPPPGESSSIRERCYGPVRNPGRTRARDCGSLVELSLGAGPAIPQPLFLAAEIFDSTIVLK